MYLNKNFKIKKNCIFIMALPSLRKTCWWSCKGLSYKDSAEAIAGVSLWLWQFFHVCDSRFLVWGVINQELLGLIQVWYNLTCQMDCKIFLSWLYIANKANEDLWPDGLRFSAACATKIEDLLIICFFFLIIRCR